MRRSWRQLALGLDDQNIVNNVFQNTFLSDGLWECMHALIARIVLMLHDGIAAAVLAAVLNLSF